MGSNEACTVDHELAIVDRNEIFHKIVQGGLTQQLNILWLSNGWVNLSSATEMVWSKLCV
jgi:hypothetical protein